MLADQPDIAEAPKTSACFGVCTTLFGTETEKGSEECYNVDAL